MLNIALQTLKKLFPHHYINITLEVNSHYHTLDNSRSDDQLEWRLYISPPMFSDETIKINRTFHDIIDLCNYVKTLEKPTVKRAPKDTLTYGDFIKSCFGKDGH